MTLSVRPSLLKRSTPLLVLGGVVAFFFGGSALYRACDRHHRGKRAAAARAADERDLAIAVQINTRFAALRDAAPSTAESCPPDVTGPIELVEKEWFDWFIDKRGRDAAPALPYTLRSTGFAYLTDALRPSSESQFDRRNAALKALLGAKYIAVATLTEAPIATKDSSFSGGTIEGTIAIGHASGHFVCATQVASAPTFIIGLRQSTPRDTASMMSYEANRQVTSDFWDAATKAVARVAPGATLVRE